MSYIEIMSLICSCGQTIEGIFRRSLQWNCWSFRAKSLVMVEILLDARLILYRVTKGFRSMKLKNPNWFAYQYRYWSRGKGNLYKVQGRDYQLHFRVELTLIDTPRYFLIYLCQFAGVKISSWRQHQKIEQISVGDFWSLYNDVIQSGSVCKK